MEDDRIRSHVDGDGVGQPAGAYMTSAKTAPAKAPAIQRCDA
jgi:hypothetical protein